MLRIDRGLVQNFDWRVFALIDSETKPGVYRSDDRGQSWRFVSDNANITARPFYASHLSSNPQNADEIWAPGNKLWRSPDGGGEPSPCRRAGW